MPVFFSVANLLSLGSQAAVWGVVAIGMTMLIMTGVTDISVGAQVYLGGIIVVRIYQMTENMLLGALCAVVICMLVSSVNGFVIAKLGLPSMIATLAMQQVCNGAASIMIGKDSVITMPDAFSNLGQSRIFNIPISVVIFLFLFAMGVVLMNHTKLGRYVITGALCGLAGTVNVSRIGGAQFGMGAQMEFSCIAAVVVGGTSMLGGSGNIIGTLMGVAVIASIDQLLRLFNVSIYLYNVFWGIVVLFTVCMDLLKKHEERREREMRLEEANENEIM